MRPALWIDLENYASSVKDVGAEALSAEAKAALISILENYQEEFGEYMDVYYPNGDAVFLADLD